MVVMKCPNCGSEISAKGLMGYQHLKCDKCRHEYQIDASRIVLYNLVPLISVGVMMFLSINFIPHKEITIKAIVILGGSFMLYRLICNMLVKLHLIYYIERENK